MLSTRKPIPRPEYPRPQFVRKEWQNLNGLWDYAIRPRDEHRPSSWDGQILVPPYLLNPDGSRMPRPVFTLIGQFERALPVQTRESGLGCFSRA